MRQSDYSGNLANRSFTSVARQNTEPNLLVVKSCY
jgi:hypothetical protein